MKKAAQQILKALIKGMLVASALIALLMVFDLYHPLFPDPYTSDNGACVLPELTGLGPESLLNGGTASELDEIPGIGEVLANRIIETRERDGLFFFPEDVMTVSGIGEKRFDDIMAYIHAQEATGTDLSPVP